MENFKILSGTTCIVTGAGGGIGKGMAQALALSGANVVIAARREENGIPAAEEISSQGGSALFVKCDVTQRSEIDAAIQASLEAFGGLNCFIHNALSYAGKSSQFIETLEDAWESLKGTAIRATYDCAQLAYPELLKTGGSYVILSSSAGVEGSSNLPMYGLAKAAQRGIAKSLAKEWGPDVRVNLINPVAMTPAMERAYKMSPELEVRLTERTPLRRIGDPAEDIGPAAVFLASPLSRFITGQTVTVDGGNFLGL